LDIITLAQVVTSVTNLLFVIVLAGGYYFTWRVSQTTLEEMRAPVQTHCGFLGATMQLLVYRLRRIILPRTPVNEGKK
jgi:hypothetical protein